MEVVAVEVATQHMEPHLLLPKVFNSALLLEHQTYVHNVTVWITAKPTHVSVSFCEIQ